MLAVAGFILGVIAAFLKATNGNPSIMLWLIIIAVLLACADVAWGVHRGGWYGRRAA
jgi:hypothetical protein